MFTFVRHGVGVVVLLTGGCLFAGSTSANLILNGGLELPAIPANSIEHVTPTDWSGCCTIFNGTFIEAGTTWPSPEEGNQFVDIGNSGTSLSQTISITTEGNYVLSWYDNTGESGGVTGSPYLVTIDSSGNTVISQPFNAYTGSLNWSLRSLDILLSPGSYDLTFSAEGVPQGLDTLLDNVSLTAAVPVPAPLIGRGLPVLLAMGEILFGAKLLERGKRRRGNSVV
jgi:hypothetical protein